MGCIFLDNLDYFTCFQHGILISSEKRIVPGNLTLILFSNGWNKTSLFHLLLNSSYEDDDHEDLCAKCNHGGELICCDKCPLAYHLECCEPPLSKVPKGDWKCEECAPKPKKKSQGSKANAKGRQ